ncbi:MAG: citrate lyase acyl carrier protein [Synergistaceae bacterium]|nr:citrate lyase acyl carrier protein [Synergistaceae bacterium]
MAKLKVTKKSLAGTLESSDVLVEVSPAKSISDSTISDSISVEKDNRVEIESVVLAQFGEALERTVSDVLRQLGVTDAHVVLHDRGALDCVVRARVETALRRAGTEEG